MRTRKGKEQPDIFGILEHASSSQQRLTGLDRLDAAIDWEHFRPTLLERLQYSDQKKGGRAPWDPVLMLKVLVLQKFHGLSDEQTEFQLLDRFSFMRFVGLQPGDGAPDYSTIWRFKEALGEDGMRALFDVFNQQLQAQGLIGKEGRIVDASFVDAPRQRNTPDQNAQIKCGERPADFDANPFVGRQKDTDARWTKKGDEVHFGYKNHVKADAASKFIEDFSVTNAAIHDSQVFKNLVHEADAGRAIFADSAYRSAEFESYLEDLGAQSCIHEKGTRGAPLNEVQRKTNQLKSQTRARVEHLFGRLTHFGAHLCRRIGQTRNTFEIALANLTYNLDRYALPPTCRA